jgi:hypothetical protein
MGLEETGEASPAPRPAAMKNTDFIPAKLNAQSGNAQGPLRC